MARPSINDSASEERLSFAYGECSRAVEAIGAAAAYLRMMLRREPRLIDFAEKADRELARAVDALDRAQEKMKAEIEMIQQRRHEQHYGGGRE